MISDSAQLYAPVDCPVAKLCGVWEFRREAWFQARAFSTPGHLLHLMLEGEYELECNGRRYRARAGDAIYYHESEEVKCHGGAEAIRFLSVSFLAPGLPPLPFEGRVFVAGEGVRRHFGELLEAARAPGPSGLSLFAALLGLLREVEFWRERPNQRGVSGNLWWGVEGQVRARRLFRPSLDELAEWAGVSRATLVRACRQATGESPARRVREIRMREASGLLRFSGLGPTQVAAQLGYPRLHEFSREFSKHFGTPPSRH